MTILEHEPPDSEILDFVDRQISHLNESGAEARYILSGVASYERLCRAIAIRFRRGKGAFETYNHVPIVVDPFRKNSIVVVPAPVECLKGVEPHRI